MFDRFTERARKTLSFARQEAQRFHHDYIGTEHMLLGIVDEGTGVAVAVLRQFDVDPTKIRAELEKIIKTGTRPAPMGQLPFTPRGKRVLELSLEEAKALGHDYIGTEHLLLGLIRENEGIAAQVLCALGMKIDRARDEVVAVLGRGPDGVPPPADRPHPPSPPTASRAVHTPSRLRWLGLLGLLGLLGFLDVRLGYLGFLGFLGFLGALAPGEGSGPRERR